MGKGEQERRDEIISNCHQTQQLHAKNNTNRENKIHNQHDGGECSINTGKSYFTS
jgi:hypothetical protein